MNFAQRQRDPRRHLAGIAAVILFHGFIVYALVTGLAKKVVDVVRAPIETKVIEEIKKPPPPPEIVVPPPPKLEAPPPPFIPPPEVQIATPPPPQPTITAVTPTPPPAPVVIAPAPPPVVAAPAPPAPPRAAARPAIANVNDCAPTSDDYPAAAKRAEATGTTRIRFAVGPDGRLAGQPEIVKSAGSSREHKMLDRLAASKLAECKFRAGVDENGKPVGASFDVDYVWKLD